MDVNLFYRASNIPKNYSLKGLVPSGVDLRAKEAEYHKSCRVEFLRETDCQEKTAALNVPRIFHKKAFESIKYYIANEVVLKETPLLITLLLTLYTEEYVTAGGEGGEIEDYANRHLTSKIKEQMSDKVTVKLADQRIGDFVFSNNMTE